MPVDHPTFSKPYKPTFRKRVRLALNSIYQLYRKIFVFNIIRVKRLVVRNTEGIHLTGFFSSVFGVAEVGRFFARQALQAGFPFSITNVHSASHKQLSTGELDFYKPYFNPASAYHKNILFLNAGEIIIYHKKNRELFTGRYNAAVFFWEFNDYFHFPGAFKVLDEVIVFTDFIATAVQKSAPAGFKVTRLHFPFIKSWAITCQPQTVRNKYSIGANDFVFFFNFDFHSVYERKNPAAILQAMDEAFEEKDRVMLVMKTVHAEQKGKSFEQFTAVLDGMKLRHKVLLINESLERNEMMNLINATDCYVSLHRSEGLGLGMMEAMSMGKPVIGTAFGGNLDFMNPENALLVDYKLVPLEQDNPPYKKGWLWAEPDIKMAAGYMRKLYNDRTYAKALGQKAQQYIEINYNVEIFAKEMQVWIQEK